MRWSFAWIRLLFVLVLAIVREVAIVVNVVVFEMDSRPTFRFPVVLAGNSGVARWLRLVAEW